LSDEDDDLNQGQVSDWISAALVGGGGGGVS